uniref:Glycine N-acyltransferase-like protein n=1 Tax=Myripristis murdjan TaxID=586833 RepID=A0A667YHF9_9TELE
MKVLNAEELRVAEGLLFKHLPKSLKVYGFLHGINKNKVNTVDVVVDTWPDFKVIICRPDLKVSHSVFTDEQILRRMLTEENSLDWSTYFMVGGEFRTELCSCRCIWKNCPHRHMQTQQQHRSVLAENCLISSLNDSHVELVNSTWKFGGDEVGYWTIKNLISNFPSCCITDDQGQPVSWILVYNYCAMGILYTLPEHRRKGYAKIVISTLARKLHAEGYPVYCFIEEDNEVSYRLFKKMGFTDDPSYRAAWFEFNF